MERAVILSEDTILKQDDFLLNAKPLSQSENLPATLEEMEQQMISRALEEHQGNYSAAAEQLGVSRQTLYNKLKKNKS